MNTNPTTGQLLTSAELAELALKAGIIDAAKLESTTAGLHNENLIRSWLAQITAELRFEMWGRCELTLQSTGNFVPSPDPELDQEMFEFFLARQVTTIPEGW